MFDCFFDIDFDERCIPLDRENIFFVHGIMPLIYVRYADDMFICLKSLEELDYIFEGFDTFELEIFKFISLLLSVKSLKYEPPNFTSGSEIP